jgi:hypothetical protein
MRRHFIRSDGKRIALETERGNRRLSPTDPLFNMSGQQLVDAWPTVFQRMIYASLVNGKGGITPYIRAIGNPNSGYTVRAEERVVKIDGRPTLQLRLISERKAALVSTLGPSTIEMIFDGTMRLPINVLVDERPPGKKPTDIHWQGSWSGPHKKYPKDSFVMQLR